MSLVTESLLFIEVSIYNFLAIERAFLSRAAVFNEFTVTDYMQIFWRFIFFAGLQ